MFTNLANYGAPPCGVVRSADRSDSRVTRWVKPRLEDISGLLDKGRKVYGSTWINSGIQDDIGCMVGVPESFVEVSLKKTGTTVIPSWDDQLSPAYGSGVAHLQWRSVWTQTWRSRSRVRGYRNWCDFPAEGPESCLELCPWFITPLKHRHKPEVTGMMGLGLG